MRSLARLPVLLAALVALALGAIGRPADAAGRIAVQVIQVLATEPGAGPKTFDPSLEELKGQLDKYSYRSFKNAGSDKKDVAAGEEATFALTGEPGFTVRVKATEAGDMVMLEISLRDGAGKQVAGPKLKVKNGGTGIISKELESKKGHLFLAFTVKKG